MSIPFFFRPVTLTSTAGLTSTLVDGGLLSNFPIDSLDRTDGETPRWPSFGITLLPNLPDGNDKVIPALSALRLLGAPHLLEDVITTVLVGRDQAYLNQPWVNARAIRVDSTDVGIPRLRHHRERGASAVPARATRRDPAVPRRLGLGGIRPPVPVIELVSRR